MELLRFRLKSIPFSLRSILVWCIAWIFPSCAGNNETAVERKRTPLTEFSANSNQVADKDAAKSSNVGSERVKDSEQENAQNQMKKSNENSTGSIPSVGSSGSKVSTSTENSVFSGETLSFNYDGFFYPLKMKECHDEGKVYDRSTLECHATRVLANKKGGYSCQIDSIIRAFNQDDSVKKELSAKLENKWMIDQCGLEGQNESVKKKVTLVCFTEKTNSCSQQPVCKDPKELDPRNTRFCLSRIEEE